jgi:hypothetical protein
VFVRVGELVVSQLAVVLLQADLLYRDLVVLVDQVHQVPRNPPAAVVVQEGITVRVVTVLPGQVPLEQEEVAEAGVEQMLTPAEVEVVLDYLGVEVTAPVVVQTQVVV